MVIEQKVLDRFWEKVDVKGKNDCWEWIAKHKVRGYGRFKLNRKDELAHRVSWQIANGSIPEGMNVLHRCDNPGCVNPEHLFLGTHADNMRDALSKGRLVFPKGETHGCSKLTENQVISIREEYDDGDTLLVTLAKKYNVDASNIGCIVQRKTWRHI